MKRFAKQLLAAFRREDGTASIEFVLIVPVFLSIFMASFESGLYMVRNVMLERAVDITMRELRLGHYPNPTHALLKDEICAHSVVIPDCENVLRVHLQPISTTAWDLPGNGPICLDRSDNINPIVGEVTPGEGDEIMLVRVCALAEPLFPTTGIGLGLPKEGGGAYGLIAMSAFVNEPS